MEKEIEEDLLNKCLRLVETKLGWGSSELWTTRDFEELVKKIEQETRVNLSMATLKRLWGKMKYDSKPTTTTLDALAQFGGYQNWRDFVQRQSLSNGSNGGIENRDTAPIGNGGYSINYTLKKNRFFILSCLFGGSLLLAAVMFLSNKSEEREFDPTLFSFTSRKVISAGVPNTVVFDYDAGITSSHDTILIQQSWDSRLQQQVSRQQKQATSIYYYPGFFKAKLIVNDQVVKEHDLLINTEGWLPLVRRGNDVPVYFTLSDAEVNGVLTLPIEKIVASNIRVQPDLPTVDYYNVGDFGDLKTDDFKFETRLMNTYKEGTGACQRTKVELLCEGNFISIPLAARGCIADLKLYFLGNEKDGEKEDMSDFGCDFSDFITLSCEVRNKQCRIHINDRLVYEAPFQSAAEKITGIVFSFEGTGSVDLVKFSKSNGELVFEDQF